MPHFTRSLLAVLGLVMIAAIAQGQIPRQIAYQGVLYTPSKQPWPDTQNPIPFTFELIEGTATGAVVWTEAKSLPVVNGCFSHVLGEDQANSFPTDAFCTSQPYFLQISVNGNPVGLPVKLLPVPYAIGAFCAETAKHADEADHALTADHATTADQATNATYADTSLRSHRADSSRVALTAYNGVPIGTIIAFAGTKGYFESELKPQGWRLCDGSPIDLTLNPEYTPLFTALQHSWGGSNSSTTFHLPDLRGRFLRAVDDGAGIDPDVGARTRLNGGSTFGGDMVGSVQPDAFKAHNHALEWNGQLESMYLVTTNLEGNNPANRIIILDPEDEGPITISQTGEAETRPQNAYTYMIIYCGI